MWDKKIPYKKLESIYVSEIKKYAQMSMNGCISVNESKRLTYFSILLAQLKNGCRITEAIIGLKKFKETKLKEFKIEVLKQKKPKKRPFVVPDIVYDYFMRGVDVISWIDYVLDKPNRIQSWVQSYMMSTYNLKTNTHTNRHQFVQYCVLEKNTNPVVIAQITGHSDLSVLLDYTAGIKANKLLKDITGE